MCKCQHKIHWSVVSLIVCGVALVFYTTSVATPHWAHVTITGNDVIKTGLFQACSTINNTCYDTHVYFDQFDEKELLVASAVLNVFALIGMYLFFSLSVFFLCGLFEEKALATGALVTSYLSGILAITGSVLFASTIRSMGWSLSWSFILAVLGFCIDIAAGVLMCVGRNVSTRRKRRKKLERVTSRELPPIEEARTDGTEMTERKVPIGAAARPAAATEKKVPLGKGGATGKGTPTNDKKKGIWSTEPRTKERYPF